MRSPKELEKIKEGLRERIPPASPRRATFVVEMGTEGIAAGAREVVISLMEALRTYGLSDCTVVQTVSGIKHRRPPVVSLLVHGQPVLTYEGVRASDAARIVSRHLLGSQVAAI